MFLKMAIPDYQTLMLPLLQYVAEGQRHGREAANFLADKFSLTEEERSRLLPAGRKQLMRESC